jgi:CHAT domain-containing protein
MDGLFPRLRALPFARDEAGAIERAVCAAGGSATLLLGEDATLKQLLASAGRARFLQLATHGITGTAEHPYGAALALTRPPRPTAGDIGYLRLEDLVRESWRDRLRNCELVVLSACDTQRGVEVGDCVMSLPWGFFYAGAPSVVASLWRVDDKSTAQLMGGFYQDLMGPSQPGKPAAFRAARLRLKSNPAYGHPYHWAAFVYLGSPD